MRLLALISVILALTACAEATPAGLSDSAIQTAIAQTQVSQPTKTINPTATQELTDTPNPTDTITPTKTPKPTSTQLPTHTPSPTRIIPTPIVLQGSGDTIVDFDWPNVLSVALIAGNAANTHFAVIPYDSTGERGISLVNTGEPYIGIVPINFDGNYFTRFQILATGDWTIVLNDISEAHQIIVPGTYQGEGDDVLVISGGIPDIATISGNATGNDNFAVIPYNSNGDRQISIVNTGDSYEGTVIVERDAKYLQVMATGPWTISITSPK